MIGIQENCYQQVQKKKRDIVGFTFEHKAAEEKIWEGTVEKRKEGIEDIGMAINDAKSDRIFN